MAIGWILKCISGPRLYRIYKTEMSQGKLYEPNCLEAYSDNIVRSLGYALSFAWSLAAFTSPVIAYVLYRRGFCTLEGFYYLSRLASVVVVVWVGTLCLRGVGRCANRDYLKFIAALEEAATNKAALRAFDGDFDAWPVDFSWSDVESSKDKPRVVVPPRVSGDSGMFLTILRDLPLRFIGYLCIHSFGRHMMYPGAVKLFQAAIGPMLLEGRAKLMEQHGATRYKLATRDGNFIDTVFVDRRGLKEAPQGQTLILCCEGNAGFYEVGITATPIDAQYSVLGWNHPGFAGSTGVPFPAQEQNAIDVVMQFAIHRLGFRPENIILYAWSIGAYTASWCAMNYPDIKGLILDATFDDVVPLAASKMPGSIGPIVVRTVADYFNLNNAEQTNRYSGPILMYRRTNDEIISTDINNRLGSNRVNDLVTKVLRHRFPAIITNESAWVLAEWLSGDRSHQKILYEEQRVDDAECERWLREATEAGDHYPLRFGTQLTSEQKVKLILYLARRHLFDFNSTHCVPLPAAKFQEPWDLRQVTSDTNRKSLHGGRGGRAALEETATRSSSSDSDFCRLDQEACESGGQ
ncbi:abhydrolase domain-containing protein 16A-like [Tropilaelaps mercedesae]|uniref:Abhydrolase domain-containing protein 16A-like n=1 Tax=Tropilaelaps mercedesae TaxID=418985 RepID=A0A1V9XGC5_9ACAR|nr:abhydrolase domain-containing protein 16A-like [Tropilaelaps mercedesae]